MSLIRATLQTCLTLCCLQIGGVLAESQDEAGAAAESQYSAVAKAPVMSAAQQQKAVEELDQAIQAMLQSAHAIAREKGQNASAIEEIEQLHQQGLKAKSRQDWAGALDLLESAHKRLQNHVVTLRFGDNLTVGLPTVATEQAWLDSKRRYEDWQFVANWLMSQAGAMNLDAARLDEANKRSNSLYQAASEEAKAKRWSEANRLMDEAYSVMETAWREQGIEI